MRRPYEVLQIDQDWDPAASWGDFDTFDEAHEAFSALVAEKPDDAEHGYVVRHNGRDVAINPPRGVTVKVIR